MSEKNKVGVVWQWIKGICSPQEEKENDEGADVVSNTRILEAGKDVKRNDDRPKF